jgi:hypothetical protein
MTELVRELEAVLGPMGVAGRQADRNPTGRRPLEVGLRMVRTIIDINSGELSVPAVPPKFKTGRLQKRREIGRTNSSKAARLNPEIQRMFDFRSRKRSIKEEETRADDGKID